MNVTPSSIRNALLEHYSMREAAWISRIVCCEMLGQSQVDFYLGKDMILSSNKEKELEYILSRLANFEPIQYIQGFARFFGYPFAVSPNVLIPRPETEELVELVLNEVSGAPAILDIGTGSGCIAISLSKALPEAKVEAWDVSERALAVARANNETLGAAVCFEQRDVLLDILSTTSRFDVIVSNPPYVTESDKKEMERNVLDWEPASALFVPDEDPLRFYRRIAEIGLSLLVPGGKLYFEINRSFGQDVVEILIHTGYSETLVRKDISGNDRFVSAERRH